MSRFLEKIFQLSVVFTNIHLIKALSVEHDFKVISHEMKVKIEDGNIDLRSEAAGEIIKRQLSTEKH